MKKKREEPGVKLKFEVLLKKWHCYETSYLVQHFFLKEKIVFDVVIGFSTLKEPAIPFDIPEAMWIVFLAVFSTSMSCFHVFFYKKNGLGYYILQFKGETEAKQLLVN